MTAASVAGQARGGDTIVVTGATGQIGYEAIRELAPLGRVVGLTRADLDLGKPAVIRDTIRALRPVVIVNAAAYTAVDRAESEPELCAAINADGPAVLAEEARRARALLIHYSTDYVFDGRKGAPYVETDVPSPLNVYGATKLAGEQAIEGVGGAYLILRTSWVYGTRGSNFVGTMLRLARQRHEIRVVHDQTGAPTWSRAVAGATRLILERLSPDWGGLGPLVAGTYHLSAAGATTWYGFARSVLDGDPRRDEQICQRLTPISTEEYAAPARRPQYSVLDSSRATRQFGVRLPDWAVQLQIVLAEMTEPDAMAASPTAAHGALRS